MIFNPFEKNKKSYLGVDIGTTSIKVVEIEIGKDKPILKNYAILESAGHLERQNDVIQTSTLKIVESDTSKFLKSLLLEMDASSHNTFGSLPSFSAFTSLIEAPFASNEEIAQAMTYQAKSLIPMAITDVTIDWLQVGERTDGNLRKKQIFLLSVPNEEIRKYETIFKNAGISLRSLEIEGLSLARLLTAGETTDTLIIDIGARSTGIFVAANGFLKYNAQTDFGGSSLTQAISNGLGINIRRAEELKKQRGLLGSGGEYELSTLMLPYLDVILNEGKRAKDNYEKTYNGKIERVILSGGGANLLGIDKYTSEFFALPTEKANPWNNIEFNPQIAPLVSEIGPFLSVAIGLAIKQ